MGGVGVQYELCEAKIGRRKVSVGWGRIDSIEELKGQSLD
jgi:hypothetical protein